jgi:hypothetical protein
MADEKVCDRCDGSGRCYKCGGTGKFGDLGSYHVGDTPMGPRRSGKEPAPDCPECEGTGTCQKCLGTGKLS